MNCKDKTSNNTCKRWARFVSSFTTNWKRCELGMQILTYLSKRNTDWRSNARRCWFQKYKNGRRDTMHQKPVRANNLKTCECFCKISEKACCKDKCVKCPSSMSPKDQCSKMSWESFGKSYKIVTTKQKEWENKFSRVEFVKESWDSMKQGSTNTKTN